MTFIWSVHKLDASIFLPNINGLVERSLIFCTYWQVKKRSQYGVSNIVNKCRQDKSNHLTTMLTIYHLPTILGSITYGTMPFDHLLMISWSPAPLFLVPLLYSSISFSWYGNRTMSPNSSRRKTNVHIKSGASVDGQTNTTADFAAASSPN